MKKKILVIPAPIKSHIIPIYNFIRTNIDKENYEVYWAIANTFSNLLIEEKIIKTNAERIISMYRFDEYAYQIGKFFHFFTNTNNIFRRSKKRINELTRVIKEVKPDIVLVDIFSSSDIFVLYNLGIKIITFSPMLSVYTDSNILSKKVTLLEKINYQVISLLLGVSMIRKNYICHSIIHFDKIPEIVLAPVEIDIFSDRLDFQTYCGLCVDMKSFNASKDFKLDLESISEKIIYCSFGTYYASPNEFTKIINFLSIFIEALSAHKNLFTIIVVNEIILEPLKLSYPNLSNIVFFKNVPQIEVLKYSSMFVTHGGLGSVKEAIFSEVPMLVYPLDADWDQPKNAKIVETLKIGIFRELESVSVEQISNDIITILDDTSYKNNIVDLHNVINQTYQMKNYSNMF